MIQVLKREGGVWGGGGEARREQQEARLLESTFGFWLSLLLGKERGGMEGKEPVDWLDGPGSGSGCKVRALKIRPNGGTGSQ